MDWHRQQRLRSIEIILHWQGRLNTGDLIAANGEIYDSFRKLLTN